MVPAGRLRLPRDDSAHPTEEIDSNFVTVNLVEHFVPAGRIVIVINVLDTRRSVSIRENSDTFELQSNRIFRARKHIDRQVLADLAKTNWIGELRSRGEE